MPRGLSITGHMGLASEPQLWGGSESRSRRDSAGSGGLVLQKGLSLAALRHASPIEPQSRYGAGSCPHQGVSAMT